MRSGKSLPAHAQTMKLDGLIPSQGSPVDGPAGAKRGKSGDAKPAGKSFADILKQAVHPASTPSAPAPTAPVSAAPADAAAAPSPPSADDHLGTIKYRLQTGYYKSTKVDDALSEKLSGYFDEIG